MANVSQLQPALTPQVQTSSSEAPEKDADFLALRLLNKRGRLRLSPEPLDVASFPGKATLFAIANSKGWFTAVIREASGASAFALSPLADLRSALAAASAEDEQSFRPQRRVPINGAPPHIITFACNDSRMLLGLVDGSIHVYSSDQLFSGGEAPLQPIHVFTTSSTSLLSIQPNPGDIPELVAVLRDCTNNPGSLAVELFDVQKLISSGGWMAGKSPSTTPTTISWSPRGKQLALGLQSGDIITFSPTATATPKSSIPHPPSANNMSVISVHWLSTSSFHTIYAPPGPLTPDLEQIHFHVSLDSKNNSAQDIRFNNPYLPFPGLRPPGEFILCLRGWNPSKMLLFIGDSTSSDIGLIGSVTDASVESWHNLSLEETSTPSLPLDKDQNDTILLGMDVDLSSSESYHHSTASGEALELPAHPIMFVYASDGTILGWHILNVTGAPYPGMITTLNASTSTLSVPSAPGGMVRELSSDMQTTPTISPTTSAPTEAPVITPPSTVFGQSSTPTAQSSTFGTPGPAFGQSTFGQSGFSQQPPPVFGKAPSFGQSTTPAFGSTSTPTLFGQSSTSTFGSAAPSAGFGSFSSTGPAKFGQSTFGFGGPSQMTSVLSPSTSAPEESMAADDGPSFGGFGLGAANSQDADSKPSIFGKAGVPPPSNQQSADDNLIKPGTGFGAFGGGFDQKSPFAKPSAFSSAQQPAMAFGAKAFQTKSEGAPSTSFGASPSFGTGQSAFGQPAFGQSSFGQFQTGASGFGKTSFAAISAATPPVTPSISTSSGGAFSAYASGNQSAFSAAASKNAPSAKPVWATNDASKPPESLGKPAEPPETKTPVAPSTTGTPSAPSPFTATAAFSATSQFVARDSVARDDDDSRPSSPAPIQQKETTSSFSSSIPGPSTGAFSNLQTTPSAFIKPASGSFGELPKDSPFFASKPPVSAFPLAATPSTPASTPPKASSAQPSFGAPSMPGGAFKSAFSTIAATPTQPPPVPSGGAFSTFSSGGGGFAAFSSGGNKSFSDLLRSAGEEKSSGAAASETTPKKPDQVPQPSVSTTPTSTPAQGPPKPPPTPPAPPKLEKEEPGTVVEPNEVVAESKEISKETIPVQEPSLESIPSSTSSSFVKVSEEEGEVVEEEATGEEELQDDEESFLSDELSESEVSEEEESEPPSETSDEEGTEERLRRETEPTEIPLPITPASTRSPSTTPKAEHPKIAISVSPPPQAPSPPSVPRVSPVGDLGTTPPGSPVKDAPSAPVPTPQVKASPPPASPFSLAPRPNNRPIRSSPLANTPLVLEGEAEKSVPVSRSAPPVMVAQPATPKTPFGQWTPTPLAQPTGDDSARPNTPPLLSVFPAPGEKPAPAIFIPAATRAPVPSVFAPTEKVATTTIAPTTTTPGPSGPLFTLPASFPSFPPSITTSGAWGTPSKTAEAAPSTAKVVPPLFGGQPSLFGAKMGPTTPVSSSLFASPVPSIVPSPGPVLPVPRTQTPVPTLEQGMQAECHLLLSNINKELDLLKELATAASVKIVELKKTSGVVHRKADLGDPRKWAFNDIEEYGKVLVGVQEDVKELKLQRVSMRKTLKELDSNVLKVTTRKEEIVRFNKARTDAEFAKMLKIRTLAPEYSETQSQLRKNIRAIKDRVQKLEDHLQTSKKRINELRTGRPSIRPPSLDTVNRTFRNIDIAIDQQKQEVSQLRHRMAKLEISGGVGAREQLAVSASKRPLNVTPNVAVTTAATLNAERSAQRLKKALLAARAQPLLNTTATASPVPTSFQTPQKPTVIKPEVTTPEAVFSMPTMPMMSFPPSLPGWTSPSEFGSPVSHDISPSRNRGGSKHHQKPVAFKKSASMSPGGGPTQQPSPAPSLFEWKPVEPVRPVSSLPFALRPAGSS